MSEADSKQFDELQPEHELHMKFDGAHVEWCQTQDIIGIFSQTPETQCHSLEIYRLGWEVDKIASEMMAEEPTAIAFAQHGGHIAVGFKDGSFSILKTESLEQVCSSSKLGHSSPITTIAWKFVERGTGCAQCKPEHEQLVDPHFQKLLGNSSDKAKTGIDPKPLDITKDLFALCEKVAEHENVVYTVDASGQMAIMYGGFLQVAQIDLRRLLGIEEDFKISKMVLSDDCAELMMQLTANATPAIVRLDTRAVTSLVLNNQGISTILRRLPIVVQYIDFIIKRIALCKRDWSKFYNKYIANMRVLSEKVQERQARHRSSATSAFSKSNPICAELIAFLVHSHLSDELYTFIVGELTNTNILNSLAENLQVQLQLVLDEIQQRVIPATQRLLLILTNDIRANLKAKLASTGTQSPQLYLGIDLDKVQALIDKMNLHMCMTETLVNDIVRAKRELRNLFVFLNNQVLKIHNRKQDLKEQQEEEQEQPPEREEISNSKNDLAKLNANLGILHETVQNSAGDSYLLLKHLDRYFEDSRLNLAPDIVTDTNSEDFLLVLRQQSVNPVKIEDSVDQNDSPASGDRTLKVKKAPSTHSMRTRSSNKTTSKEPLKTVDSARQVTVEEEKQAASTPSERVSMTPLPLRSLTTSCLNLLKTLTESPMEQLSPLINLKSAPVLLQSCQVLDICYVKAKQPGNGKRIKRAIVTHQPAFVFRFAQLESQKQHLAVVKFDGPTTFACWLASPQDDRFDIGKTAFEVNCKEVGENGLPSWKLLVELGQREHGVQLGEKRKVFIEHFDLVKEFQRSSTLRGSLESTDFMTWLSSVNLQPQSVRPIRVQGLLAINLNSAEGGIDAISTGNRSIYSVLVDRNLLKLYWPDYDDLLSDIDLDEADQLAKAESQPQIAGHF